MIAARSEVDLERAVADAFQPQADSYGRNTRQLPVMVLVQPLRQPAVRARVPDAGDLEARGRHRRDGLAPLHRMPLLHRRLPYGSRSFNWVRPAAVSSALQNRRLPDSDQGRGGEMHVLFGTARGRPSSGVRRGMPGERAGVRESWRMSLTEIRELLRSRYHTRQQTGA